MRIVLLVLSMFISMQSFAMESTKSFSDSESFNDEFIEAEINRLFNKEKEDVSEHSEDQYESEATRQWLKLNRMISARIELKQALADKDHDRVIELLEEFPELADETWTGIGSTFQQAMQGPNPVPPDMAGILGDFSQTVSGMSHYM